MDSPDDICAVASLQPYRCPIHEDFGGLGYQDHVVYQTMLRSSSFMIRKRDYMAGFFLVLKIEDRKSCQIIDKKEEVGRNILEYAALEKSFRFDNKLTYRTYICIDHKFSASLLREPRPAWFPRLP